MLKIGLIDNYPIARKGLSLLLEGCFPYIQICGAGNTAELQKKLNGQVPDIIILGNNARRRSTVPSEVTVCRAAFADARMIVLDETYQRGNSAFYLRSGVMGHLLKECPVSELIKCVENIERNKCFLSARLHSLALDEMAGINSLHWTAPPVVVKNTPLTAKELQIAFYLSQGKGTSYIAKLMKKAPSQVSGMKRRILKKMALDNVLDLAKVIDKHNLESLVDA